MRMRTRHPRLAAAACMVYGLIIWMYPGDFGRAYGHELTITFRNRVEDTLNDGGILQWMAFAVHIAWDSIRAYSLILTESRAHDSVSLLGLSKGDWAHGCINRPTIDVQFMFAVAGLAFAFFGWYTFITFPIT
jgi:hypothetical protein